jgi:hypothetical protein
MWVIFPGGFQSPATLMKVDRDWDLAALVIWKPNVEPLPVSTQAPQLGERLTVAGYGRGWYRAASGQCIKYYSPDENRLPREWVEISVPSRSGDSGGPILNDRGEIAGVLWGSDSSYTLGSYCGRLRQFLAPLGNHFQRLPPPSNMLAQQIAKSPPTQQVIIPTKVAQTPCREISCPVASQKTADLVQKQEPPNNTLAASRPLVTNKPLATIPATPIPSAVQEPKIAGSSENCGERGAVKTESQTTTVEIPTGAATLDKDTPFNQLKNFLAVIGLLALFLQGLKILGKAAG